MKIYLAGKIAANDWRHDIVQDKDQLDDGFILGSGRRLWRTVPIPGTQLVYVGPYFEASGHGYAHDCGDHGTLSKMHATAERCRAAIDHCDIFFAWMGNGETAFGTLVEIGIASALKKKIFLAWPLRQKCQCSTDNRSDCGCMCDCKPNELWFAAEQATWNLHAPNPVEAFQECKQLLSFDALKRCESPLEELFYKTYLAYSPVGHIRQQLQGLAVQYPVTVNGHTYRLDFALPEKRIAFEMDGYTYHGKERSQFNRDRRRDLELKLAGWEVHRFDGDMIRDDVTSVIHCAAELASRTEKRGPSGLTLLEHRKLSGRQREELKALVDRKLSQQ